MYNVLIIEDDKNMRETLEDIFQLQGYKVWTSVNGEEGFELAKVRRPHLIISDVMMPEKDGFSLLKSLKTHEHTRLTPVILLTALNLTDDKIKGLEYGADDYITKPFDTRELLLRVNNLIRRQESWKQQALLKPQEVEVESQDERFLRRVRQSLEAHLSDPDFNVNVLASECHISLSGLQKKIKKLTNKSLSQLIREYRLERAADLLRQRAGNISEISKQVGFGSLSYFSVCFRNYFGYPPTQVSSSPEN